MRWLATLLACTACGGGFDYEGTAGTPQSVSFPGLIPTGPIVIDDTAAQPMGFDTGSPVTFCDLSAYPSRSVGAGQADVSALGLGFRGYPTLTLDAFGEGSDLAGLVGGDLLGHFGFSIDYKGSRAWLSDPFDPTDVPDDLGAGAETTILFQLEGGGRFNAGSDTVEAGRTRILFQVRFEGRDPVWAMLDSGASSILLRDGLHAALGDTANRPRLDGVPVGTVSGTVDAFYTRVWRADVEGVSVDDVPAFVIPGTSLFASISSEVGVNVEALIGGHFLRSFFTTVDYPRRLVRLARYVDPGIDPREWIGPGFRMEQSGDDWQVSVVYPDTDAAAKGLLVGDVVERIGSTAIRGLDAGAVNGLLDGYDVGADVPLEVDRGGTVLTLQVLVEDLLPNYPPPI